MIQAQQLQRLAQVADLSRLDGGSVSCTLESDGSTVRSSYYGTFAAGCVVEHGDVPEMCVTLDGTQFKAIAALFDKKDSIEIAVLPSKSIRLSGGGQAANLRIEHSSDPWTFMPEQENYEFCLQAHRDDLAGELEYAGLFIADEKALPVLTGVRVSVTKGRVMLNASDSVMALYATQLSVKEVDGEGFVVVSASDTVAGLKLMSDGIVRVYQQGSGGNKMVVDDGKGACFYTVGLAGDWPDFARAVGKPGPSAVVDVPSYSIRSVATASAALKAGADIEIVGQETGDIIIRTVKSDAGAFALRHGQGEMNFVGTRLYDGDVLTLATKLADSLQFSIPEDKSKPTTIRAGGRTLFLIPKYSR